MLSKQEGKTSKTNEIRDINDYIHQNCRASTYATYALFINNYL